MANTLLPQITTQIERLVLSTSPPSSSFDQPSHILKLRGDLEALQRMVWRIQAVLADAERREIHDELVKLWLRELSCLAYDVDDVLDDYNYEVLRAQVKDGIQSDGASSPPNRKPKRRQEKVNFLTMASSSSSSDGSRWNKLADRMGKIRLKFEEISRDREALQLREGAVRERQNVAVRPPSTHLPDKPKIFGREKIMEEVINMLLSTDGGQKQTLSVLPIVGMGGVGKTTLVQHVYNDQRVCEHFKLKGWVCVSEDFEVVSLSRRIIVSLTGDASQPNEFDVIQSKLIQLLKRDRFLVVLDDVWNETPSFWDTLLKPFRLAGVEGSAAIVTTRIESIARMVETMPFLRLGGLSADTCWLIFEQNAFLGRDPADCMDLMQIGKKLVEKCKGLPLAVKVLGSLLRNECDRDRWEEILQSEVWDVPEAHDEIIPALRLSYLHLPSYLKPCFLYASVFPKDRQFRKEQLVQLWMAQGFLQPEGREQVEDIGNRYFDELMQRSFFSPDPRSPLMEESNVMHDLIHDLAQHISEGVITSCIGHEEDDQDKLFLVGGRKAGYRRKVRHLSIIHQSIEGIEWMLQSLSDDEPQSIRSLLVPSHGRDDDVELRDDDVKLKLPSEMMLNFKSLRALDLGDCVVSELPDSMGYLRHLRYLNLRVIGIRRLPETIGMLYNLQVLKLEACYSMKNLPEGIGGLCNLRYLNLSKCYNLMSLPESIGGLFNLQCLEIKENENFSYPRGMSRLTNLRSLHGFYVSGEGHDIELLKDMVHLRGRLEIRGLQNVVNPEDAVTANLRNKERIKQLFLCFGDDRGNDDDCNKAYRVLENLRPYNGLEELEIEIYNGVRFPSWMGGDLSSFSQLTHVALHKCTHCTLLPPLGQLPSLKKLTISNVSSVERVGPEFRGVGFPALEELHFMVMPSWVTWDAAARGDFPRLRMLRVSYCPKLQSMVPLYLFPALQELNISSCHLLPWIELKSSPLLSLSLSCSSACSSSSSSSIGPPPLLKMSILKCPLARFKPEDDPLLLPVTLEDFSIDYGCPLLWEWCRRGDVRTRLAHIPRVDIPGQHPGAKHLSWGQVFKNQIESNRRSDRIRSRITPSPSSLTGPIFKTLPWGCHNSGKEEDYNRQDLHRCSCSSKCYESWLYVGFFSSDV